MRILYLEENPHDAGLTLRTLPSALFQIELVSTFQDALARLNRLNSDPLDLVLTELQVRDGGGLALLRHIRENRLPLAVVIVTGVGSEETAIDAFKGRADDYVVKREDYLERLPCTLESSLNHYRANTASQANPLAVLYAQSDLRIIEETHRHFALHADHIQLDVVYSGLDVLTTLGSGSSHHDVLLMDLNLSELDGLAVLKELRLTLKQDLPVVLISDLEGVELSRQGLKYGVSRCVAKTSGYLHQLPWQLEEAHSRAVLLRRKTALTASEARNRALLNAIPDLFFVQSRDGTYLDYHAKEPYLLPMPPQQFLGKKIEEVMPPALVAEFLKCFEKASDKRSVVEYTLSLPDGEHVFESSIVTCEGDKILNMVRDISERKRDEESLTNALAEVRRLKDRLHEENIYLQEERRDASYSGEIIGKSEPLHRVLRQAQQVAHAQTTVLILGETGTGKELMAHAIHNLSRRQKRPLVKVNCAALPAELIESELFGHEKGAFTGAGSRRLGRFALADGGTIFLDEIGELPLGLQAKLLRVLEEGEFELVGSSRTVAVDVRVIAATNRDLSEAVQRGTFRSDLYYRLNIFPIVMPSLRERLDDIEMLVIHLVRELNLKLGKQINSIPQSIITRLENYDWPGNVRELRNVIERAVIITQGRKLQLIDSLEPLRLKTAGADSPVDRAEIRETLEQGEYRLILSTLKSVHWRVEGPGGAAELLDVHASTLRSRMRKLGIVRPRVQAATSSGPSDLI